MLSIDEALRYALVRTADDALRRRMAELAEDLQRHVQPRWVWHVLPVSALPLEGTTARRMLAGCKEAVLLAATLGTPFDALLRRMQLRDMADALLLDALGSAYVEAACEEAEAEIALRFPEKHLTDRFSPGYGDLPLDTQRTLLDTLDANRRIGLTVTESLLLAPQKSVTALLGLSEVPQPSRIRGCAFCTLRENCPYKKEGRSCEL